MSFICIPNEEEYEMSRNFADVSETITVLTEIYWDLRSKVSVSCHTHTCTMRVLGPGFWGTRLLAPLAAGSQIPGPRTPHCTCVYILLKVSLQ